MVHRASKALPRYKKNTREGKGQTEVDESTSGHLEDMTRERRHG